MSEDLFAPPSQEENDLFAPPSKEEADLFAPPTEQEQIDTPSEISLPELAKTGAGGIAGLLAGEGIRRGGSTVLDNAAGGMSGLAEDLAYRGIGGRTTSDGKKFYTDSLGKNVDPDMVNITPRSVGRQVLDENISGALGISSPETQLINQRNITQSKMGDKANFLSGIDSPNSIDKQALLAEYERLTGAQNLDPALEVNRKIMSGLEKDAPNFEGMQSILENEKSKAELQSRSNYSGTSKESARQSLDKSQAEARRIASENAVKSKLGQEGLDEFKALKQRSGNASVAESIIAKNALTDGTSPGTIGKLSKIAGEVVLEKAPAVGAKVVDFMGDVTKKASKTLKSGAGKLIPAAGMLIGGAAGALAAQNSGMEGGDVIASAVVEALNPIPFTDASGAYIAGRQEFDKTGSLSGAAKTAGSAYVKTLDEFGATRSNDARSRMEQNMKASPNPTKKNNDFLNFVSKDPESLKELAATLQGTAGSYSGPLLKAAEADERKRSAILFGLYQQPAFRSMVGDNMESNIPGVKTEEE